MLKSLANHPYKKNFYVYWACFFIYGFVMVSLGPFIPYISAQTGIIQTEYSFLFTFRSLGMLLGVLILKVIQSHTKMKHNHLIAGIFLIMGVSSIFFSWSLTTFGLIFWIFLQSMGNVLNDVQINVCILLISSPKEVDFWLLITHGMFGIGGFVGPVIIYLFENNTYAIVGLICLLMIPIILSLKEPERLVEDDSKPQQKLKIIPKGSDILIGLFLFFYVGSETSYGGWISSFSILAGASAKQQATFYATIYWILITVFRFVSTIAPGTSSQKMNVLIKGSIISGVLCLVLIYSGFVHFTCYFGGVLFGLFYSSLFILAFTIATQRGFTILENQTSNIILFAVLGEGSLVAIVGKLMQYISINSLFYALIFMAIMMYYFMNRILVALENYDEINHQLGTELLDKTNNR